MLSQYHRLSMEALEGLGNKFNLSNSAKNGVKCFKESIFPCLLLDAKFFDHAVEWQTLNKWLLFIPFRLHKKDFEIKDMGGNKLFFDFEEEYDLERVLEHEPWLYDKRLVILEG